MSRVGGGGERGTEPPTLQRGDCVNPDSEPEVFVNQENREETKGNQG